MLFSSFHQMAVFPVYAPPTYLEIKTYPVHSDLTCDSLNHDDDACHFQSI